jgi:hypothetical protein
MISKLTTSAKVSLGMKTLGLSSEQTRAVDDLIASVGSHPMFVIATGMELGNLKSVITLGIESMESDKPIPHLATLTTLLRNPDFRDSLATMMLSYIEKSKDRRPLLETLEKLAELPIPGIYDHEYKTHHEFLSVGVLGIASHHLDQVKNPDPEPVLVDCPHCDGVFYNNLLT